MYIIRCRIAVAVAVAGVVAVYSRSRRISSTRLRGVY